MLKIAAFLAAALFEAEVNKSTKGFTKVKDQHVEFSGMVETREIIFYHPEFETFHAIPYKIDHGAHSIEVPWKGVDDYHPIECPKVFPRERTIIEYGRKFEY